MTLSREQSLNLFLSLLLHTLVLAVAMGAPLWGAPSVRSLPVIYNVNLVTLPQPAAPAAPTASPAPAPVPTPAAPRAVAPPPPPPDEELTLPGRSRARPASPPQAVTPPPPRPAPPAAQAAPQAIVPTPFATPTAPAARAAPPGAAAANGADVEAAAGSADPAAVTYTAIISERVRSLWEPPGQGRVVVNARVLRSRYVRDVVVVRPSGNPLFDMSAVRAIQEAVPYPPFPPLMREEYVDIAFTFSGKEGVR